MGEIRFTLALSKATANQLLPIAASAKSCAREPPSAHW